MVSSHMVSCHIKQNFGLFINHNIRSVICSFARLRLKLMFTLVMNKYFISVYKDKF